jgi:hypothetical protein
LKALVFETFVSFSSARENQSVLSLKSILKVAFDLIITHRLLRFTRNDEVRTVLGASLAESRGTGGVGEEFIGRR